MSPRCSLSPNIGSIMETLGAVGHGIRLDNCDFSVFFFDSWYYFKSIASELQYLHIMFKRATERVKVVTESVLSNKGKISYRYAQPGGLSPGGLSPGEVIFVHQTSYTRFCQYYTACLTEQHHGLRYLASPEGLSRMVKLKPNHQHRRTH